MSKVWIYQTSNPLGGAGCNTTEVFSSPQKAIARHPGEWNCDGDSVWTKEIEDECTTAFLWEATIDPDVPGFGCY
jgi:hypothetical protein